MCSEHTKHALEVHPNIRVFRHPDHAPSGQALESEIISGIKNFSFKTLDIAKLPADGLKAIYGANDDIILYCKCADILWGGNATRSRPRKSEYD